MGKIRDLFSPTPFKRFLFFLCADCLIFFLSLYFSFLIRFDFQVPAIYLRNYFLFSVLFFILVKILALYRFGLYDIVWRYVGLKEFVDILKALTLAEGVLFFLIRHVLPHFSFFSPLSGYPRSIFLVDFYLSVLLVCGLRISRRVYLEHLCPSCKGKAKGALIVGAGNVGEMLVRDLKKQGRSPYQPIGFLDDDPLKKGTRIHGVPVLGGLKDLPKIVKRYGAECVLIAITTIDYRKLRQIYQEAREAGVEEIRIVPRIYAFAEPRVEPLKLEDIKIEDLLKREEVRIEREKIKDFLSGRRVLITGAGGSIGSEISRQVASFAPQRLILFEIDETELHNLMLELRDLYPDVFPHMDFIVGDITDEKKVRRVFEKYRPEIVFHAAAYKHVPMMEFNPEEAVRVNIFGTYNVARVAADCGVRKFIMISTDKAVRPTSIMGATKRVAEQICQALNNERTEFVSVRFGNVLGSRGSVLPLFLEQIKKGGPVTVTHPEMQRYFMTVSEAVALVLQASVMGRGGQIMVLDMGEPVKIVALAEELIKLHGLEPYRDIEIQFIGPRPGEKLSEELFTEEEGTQATYHERVFIARNTEKVSREEIERFINELQKNLTDSETDRDFLKRFLQDFLN